MLWRLFLILSCVIANLLAQNQQGLQERGFAVTKFDLIADEDVDDNDPRVKSIIYSAKSYPHSKIMINYVNPNALSLAMLLARIFSQHGLSTTKPEQVGLYMANDTKYVQVNIYYQE